MKKSASVLIVLLLLPLVVTSTPPRIDWFVFDVDGRVSRTSGPLANHTVVLLGRDSYMNTWAELYNCTSGNVMNHGPFELISLTDDNGEFALRVPVCGGEFDSLAVGVIYPDTTIVGESFHFRSVTPTEIEATGHSQEEGFLCDSEKEYTYIDGYIYDYPEKVVPVP
jgi:hypothetical protein